MIKLKKLDEPKILSDNFQTWTDALILHQEREAIEEKKIPSYVKNKYSHKDIKDQLKKETYGKCAYCESKILATGFGDIEHIVPKTFDTYMWFRWSNLTLGCQVCNNNKSDYYSVSSPILDPYIDQIDNHIFFAGDMLLPLTEKGNCTIKILKLNRLPLVEARNYYLKNTLDPFLQLLINSTGQEIKNAILEDLLELTKEYNQFSNMSATIINQYTSRKGSAS